MSARYGLALVVALCGSLAATGAEAAAKKRAKGDPLVARGCSHVIPPYCLGVTFRGRTYALLDASPFIPPNVGVDVYGKVTALSPCGPAIQVTAWKRNRLRCRPS
jgi:hypothetical protein